MLASGLFRFANSFYLWNWILPFDRVPERDDVRAPVMFIENVSEKPGLSGPKASRQHASPRR